MGNFGSILFVLLALVIAEKSYGQNLEKIGSDEMFKLKGGVSFNTITYFQNGLTIPSREPFTWFASGNLTLSVLDVALPFTFTYSNQGSKYTQPFNRTALHPTYKWVKSHIGVVSMNFSQYTLSGHLFLGAGVEMTPGKWNIKVMAGRLNKEIDYDPITNNLNEIVFKRYGYGIKAGYENKGYGINATLFKANDAQKSLNFIPPNTNIKPQDNLVMSLDAKAKLTASIHLTVEYALSALTQNTFALNDLSENSQSPIHKLVKGNETTDYFQAYNAALNYSLKFMRVAFKYEHIDPGYKTLGGYYFNNDLENYTLAPSFSLFKKKLNVAINTGYQRNNLSSEKAATTSRWVGSLNTTYVPSKRIVLTGTYSNFSTFTQSRPTTDPFYFNGADTLNFFQLTQAASGMISYNFGGDSLKSAIQLLYNYQESTSLNGDVNSSGAFGLNVTSESPGIPTHVHLVNLGYTAQLIPMKAAITIAGNVNRSILPSFVTTFFGPTLNFQKSLLDQKASLSFGSTYNRQIRNDALSSNILNHRFSFNFTPKPTNEKLGQTALSANANLMQRFAVDPSMVNVSEVNVFINLNYNF
ncbi:MAG: hypothetical protein ACI8ZM_002705 [Crocinitomix sp.]